MGKASRPQDRTDPQRSTLANSGANNRQNRHRAKNVNGNRQRILRKVLTIPGDEVSISILGKKLKLSRAVMSKHKIRMEREGLIKRIPGTWPPLYRKTNKLKRLNVNDFSYSTTEDEKLGAEDVFITIPIGDNSNAKLPPGFWEKINTKLRNNVQKHTHIKLGDYDVAVRETSQNVVIQMKPIRLKSFSEAFVVYNTLVNRLFRVLAHYNYWIDPEGAYCSDPEFTYLSDLERSQKNLNRKPKVKVKLGYPRTKILTADKPEEAQAWFDNTPDPGNFETNDLILARERRIFPLRILQMLEQNQDLLKLQANQTNTMNTYAKEIETHLETYRDIKQTTGEFREAVKGFKRALAIFEGGRVHPSSPSETTNTGLSGASTPKSVEIPDLSRMDDYEKVRVRICQDLKDFTVYDPVRGNRKISYLKKGSQVYVYVKQARDMISWGEAELV